MEKEWLTNPSAFRRQCKGVFRRLLDKQAAHALLKKLFSAATPRGEAARPDRTPARGEARAGASRYESDFDEMEQIGEGA